MGARHAGRLAQQRAEIAHEAARLMVESGISDYHLARRKAVERLRLGDARTLPRNEEIEFARREYQRMYCADDQPEHLRELRRIALRAMRFLAPFRPRLVGPVLTGTDDEHSDVCLHVFADPPEEVGFFLMAQGLRHDTGERRLRLSGDAVERLPTYSFIAGETRVELVVFTERLGRRQPLSPVDGRPMRRANLRAVEALAGGGG